MLGGSLIGGALGSQIGWMLGSMLGNALFPPPAQEGPRLSDLKMTTSAYGQAIPLVYGTARISGNCIWSTDKVEHQHSESQGKGGGQTVNTYSYTISSAFLICQGPISGVRKIWANSTLVYDLGSDSPAAIIASEKLGGSIRVHLGAEDQAVDPFIEGVEGTANTPAYRGTAYVMLENLELSNFGNTMPNLEFEVVVAGATTGIRKLKDINYDFSTLGHEQHFYWYGNVLGTMTEYNNTYVGMTGAGSDYGGYAFGFPFIRGIHGNTFDLSSNSSYNKMGVPSTLVNTLDQYDKTRWTIDETGAFVSSGNSVNEYTTSEIKDSFHWEHPLDADTIPRSHPYIKEYIGKAGSSFIFYNRCAPLKIGGSSRCDFGNWTPIQPFVIPNGDSPDVFDSSGLMSYLNTHATGYINSVVTTASGSFIFVMTGTNKSGTLLSEHWYLFSMNGAYAIFEKSGTVDASVNVAWIGSQGSNTGHASSMMEDSCDFIWTNENGVSLYKIGADGILKRIFNDDPGTSFKYNYFSVYARGGLCYLAGTSSAVVYTRIDRLDKNTVKLHTIISDICLRAGLTADDINTTALTDDVVGIVYGAQMSFRSMIDPLRTAYFFDAVESDGKIVFVKRGQAISADIPEEDLAARDAMTLDAPPDQLKITHQQELELPRLVTIDYFASDADFQDGSQNDSIQTRYSQNVVKLQLPIGLTDNQAKSIAMVNLYQLWAGRNTYEFTTDRSYSHLNPTDVVTINKDGAKLCARLTKRTDGGDGVISWVAQSETPTAYLQTGLGGIVKGGSQNITAPAVTDLVVFDAPVLMDQFHSYPYMFFAACGTDSNWPGCDIYMSKDTGATWSDTGIFFEKPCVLGRSASVLAQPDSWGVFDEENSVKVFLTNIGAELANATQDEVLNGANVAFLGGELIAFKRATLINPRQYELSGLLRGLKGTEDFAKTHTTGEDFVILATNNIKVQKMDFVDFGSTFQYKAISRKTTDTDVKTVTHTFTGRNQQALSPVYFNMYKDTQTVSGDWNFNYVSRLRYDGELRDGSGGSAPINDYYELEILNLNGHTWPDVSDATVARTLYHVSQDGTGVLQAPTYTTAMQTTDFGAPTSEVVTRAYTVGQTGRSPLWDVQRFTYTVPTLVGGPFIIAAKFWDLLLKFEDATIIDTGTNALTITNVGVQTNVTTPIFGTKSGWFQSSGFQYFNYTGTVLDAGYADFCFDCYILPNGLSTAYSTIFETVPNGSSGTAGGRFSLGVTSAGSLYLYHASTYYNFPTTVILTNKIYYVCLQRRSGIVEMFLGSSRYQAMTGNGANIASSGFMVGKATDVATSYWNGRMDQLRYTSICRYPNGTNIQPPSSLLLHCDGANAATALSDYSANNVPITFFGTAQLDTSTQKFGTASLKFNGATTDYCKAILQSASDLIQGDFCVQLFYKTTQVTANATLICRNITGFVTGSWVIMSSNASGNGSPCVYWSDYSAGSPLLSSSTSGHSNGAWKHLAWTKEGSVHRLFIDGTQVATITTAVNMTSNGAPIVIGSDIINNRPFLGNIDEICITRGAAVYTSNFTPPTAQFTE
jgi:hypothetical protein